MTFEERYMRDAVTMLQRIADELEQLNRKIDDMTARTDNNRKCFRVWESGPRS